jgi:hypothetical protein
MNSEFERGVTYNGVVKDRFKRVKAEKEGMRGGGRRGLENIEKGEQTTNLKLKASREQR